jgi:hypothetical protein
MLRRQKWKRRHRAVSVHDRPVLEQVILPAIRDEVGDGDVLFVGVDWYTSTYPEMFPAGNLVTVDNNPVVAKHGSDRHFTIDITRMDEEFSEGSFAAVVCNGVFGHGVDSPADVDRALAEFRRLLGVNGLLIVGWNDVAEHRTPDITEAACRAGFTPRPGAGLSTQQTEPAGPMRHVYAHFGT